ncbi:MAG: hypothetical protein C1943_11550 [Halochromatium sp.]|nr:hypothetical protein [Halochromatium sp.]
MEVIARSRLEKPLNRQILDRQRHRLCRADYQRMAEAGIFSEDDHIELIAGELIDMPPIGDEHAGLTTQLNHLIYRSGVKDALVSVQSPLVLDDHNEPEPDLMLLRFRADYYKRAKPRAADVLLLIEVADSSLSYDRSVKRPLYAQHGIAEVWIVNLQDRVVEVHRDPDGQDYRDSWLARAGDQLQSRQVPDFTLSVSELLA